MFQRRQNIAKNETILPISRPLLTPDKKTNCEFEKIETVLHLVGLAYILSLAFTKDITMV